MKHFVLLLLFFLFAILGHTQKTKRFVVPEERQAFLKENVRIRNGKISALPGDKFKRIDPNTVALIRNGVVEGNFACSCKSLDKNLGGSCKVSILRGVLICSEGSCKGTCELDIVIQGNKFKLAPK